MRNLILILLIGVFVTSANSSKAQGFLKRMADKAMEKVKEKTEEKAEEKVERKIDDGIDKAFEDMESEGQEEVKSDEERGMDAFRGMMGRLGVDTKPVEIKGSYSFSSNIKMYIETYKPNGTLESKGYLNSFFNKADGAFAYEFLSEKGSETGKGFFIYDPINKASIILSEKDGEKNGIVTGIDITPTEESRAAYKEPEKDSPDPMILNQNLKKTGKTKSILGYKCNEYLYEDDEVVSHIWMTKEKPWRVDNMLSAIYKSSQYSSAFPGGFMMEVDSRNKQTKERNIMKVTEVNENINKQVDLSSYKIMNMGHFNFDRAK
ncbi:hypothetical protein MNBD_BACTEROID01-600 [hydrothermal vent metagenome]|uniref:DUF4412 domain-containing protein n=1 Tax=hydrothermal vent metagenome TaxID=652676 RepID=A0A3B0U344_9ZZZZ